MRGRRRAAWPWARCVVWVGGEWRKGYTIDKGIFRRREGGKEGRTYRGMVGGDSEAVEEGVEPGSDERDLNEGLGFPRVEKIRKSMRIERQKKDMPMSVKKDVLFVVCVPGDKGQGHGQ